MRISVVTPSLDQARFLERTVRSVVAQEGEFELEYLVQDGGSTDGSLEILRRYEGRLRWRSEPDGGQADAVNRALHQVSGDVVGWVNSVDLLRPGALARVADAFTAHPAALWLHGGCDIVDQDDRVIRRWISAYKDRRCRRFSLRSLLLENYVSQMTVFWRRAVHERIGYLDATLRYTFDYDLWLRLAALGDPLYLPEPVAAFRWYRGSKSGAEFVRQFEEDYRVFRRHAPEDRWLLLRKKVRTAQILATYRALRVLRA